MTFRSIISTSLFFFITVAFNNSIHAQNPALKNNEEDYTWWYITLFGLIAALSVTVLIWLKKKKSAPQDKIEKQSLENNSYDDSLSFDADKELEWLRKNRKAVSSRKKAASRNSLQKNASPDAVKNNRVEEIPVPLNIELLNDIALPIFDFKQIEPAAKVEPLPLSNEESLLNAIEQSQDEYEEDEEVREVALRILAAFRTRNSVESLSQVAAYDLSSALRSKAVSTLSEFDHESVFEGVLLACADPTREVRAAAARAFSRLTFDRADAWVRIIETNEPGRMIHASRAAIEGGFVERSFDRLTHRDKKLAYEAFALVALLIKAGEVQQILDTLNTYRDLQVKRAIVHVLSVVKNETAISILTNLIENKETPEDLRKEAEKVFLQSNSATA